MKQVSTAIIGGGSAGLVAAVQLYRRGVTDITILEREKKPGGILRQCIHGGLGLMWPKETLSSPKYAQRLMDTMDDMGTPYITGTIVLKITSDKRIYTSSGEGMIELQVKAVTPTMGCGERTRGVAGIPGEWPAGVYTAGAAQVHINLQNKMVGRETVVLGSEDIDMIMARCLTPEGTHVQAVPKIQPYSSGPPRSIEQCLRDYDIPSYLSHTVTGILGEERLEGTMVSQADDHVQPAPGNEKAYACDILVLSVGLISENELPPGAGTILDGRSEGVVVDENYQISVDGIFATGNMLHIHDLMDFVSREAERLRDATAKYVREGGLPSCRLDIRTDEHITHTVPQKIGGNKSFRLSLRVKGPMSDCRIQVLRGGRMTKEQTFKKVNPAETIQITVSVSVLNCREDVKVKVI